ncbi:hypothetical protein [Paenibacillus taichungensis]
MRMPQYRALLVKLNSYAASAIELELLDQYIISGYNIEIGSEI